MNVEGRRFLSRPSPPVASWDWEREIAAAITLVARHPTYRIALCGYALRAGVLARLDAAAGTSGVVLERRIRRGGGWDVEVRAA